jgi:hypothetical protein
MARVRLTAAHHINGKSYKAGTFVCDGTSPQAGDVIWTGLTAAAFSNAMVALDAGANTLQAASRFTSGPLVAMVTGCNSIDG